ncbi:hypothetical protein TcCL_NonESM10563 [Trypanosoma cruzi]|nr:hypothetical protein TcCL_NonESM10563 [Trypanosoma cruzi]
MCAPTLRKLTRVSSCWRLFFSGSTSTEIAIHCDPTVHGRLILAAKGSHLPIPMRCHPRQALFHPHRHNFFKKKRVIVLHIFAHCEDHWGYMVDHEVQEAAKKPQRTNSSHGAWTTCTATGGQ